MRVCFSLVGPFKTTETKANPEREILQTKKVSIKVGYIFITYLIITLFYITYLLWQMFYYVEKEENQQI